MNIQQLPLQSDSKSMHSTLQHKLYQREIKLYGKRIYYVLRQYEKNKSPPEVDSCLIPKEIDKLNKAAFKAYCIHKSAKNIGIYVVLYTPGKSTLQLRMGLGSHWYLAEGWSLGDNNRKQIVVAAGDIKFSADKAKITYIDDASGAFHIKIDTNLRIKHQALQMHAHIKSTLSVLEKVGLPINSLNFSDNSINNFYQDKYKNNEIIKACPVAIINIKYPKMQRSTNKIWLPSITHYKNPKQRVQTARQNI